MYPRNKLLEFRGNAGTHDLNLLRSVLEKLCKNEGEVNIPVYNKTACLGRGDREPESLWKKIRLPVDIILIEGWMLGFRSQKPSKISSLFSQCLEEDKLLLEKLGLENSNPCFRQHTEKQLLDLNKQLEEYHLIWDKLALLIQLKPEKLSYVFDWRWEQEYNQPNPGLTQDQVKIFVERFMPAYEIYLLFLELPNRPHYTMTLNNQRGIQLWGEVTSL